MKIKAEKQCQFHGSDITQYFRVLLYVPFRISTPLYFYNCKLNWKSDETTFVVLAVRHQWLSHNPRLGIGPTRVARVVGIRGRLGKYPKLWDFSTIFNSEGAIFFFINSTKNSIDVNLFKM